MNNFKYAQKKLTAEANTTYSDSNSGMIPTSELVVKKCFSEYMHFFKDIDGPVMHVRPLSMGWTCIFPEPTKILSYWAKKALNRKQRRLAKAKYGMNLEVKTKQDQEEIESHYQKVMKKSLRTSSIFEIRMYVERYLKIEWLKCFYGNPPFGNNTDSQGQYICWPILKLALAMLDPKCGVAAVIIPSSFLVGRSDNLKELRNELLPYLEYVDMDANNYFKQAGNEPSIVMSGIVVNFAKTSDTVQVKKDNCIKTIKTDELYYYLNPLAKIVDNFLHNTKKLLKLEDVFITDVKQSNGGTDKVPVSQGKMIKTGYASKKFDFSKGHTEPFYYSVVKMFTSKENIKNHYDKTNGVLSLKFNYSGYLTKIGKEEYYMPIDTIPSGKCSEGLPVNNYNEGKNARICYTRKLPVFICENIKGNNAFNPGIYILPYIEKCKTDVVTDEDWYNLAQLTKEEIKIVEDWYDIWSGNGTK
tara:strand:- start:10 stop:1422 length:1413 start_codon:yes stop_codon:yes gene_type:complete